MSQMCERAEAWGLPFLGRQPFEPAFAPGKTEAFAQRLNVQVGGAIIHALLLATGDVDIYVAQGDLGQRKRAEVKLAERGIS